MPLLAAVVLVAAVLALPQDPAYYAEAERLARSGAHAEALSRFQALAAANPDDVQARMWIARLHALMHHPQRALDVYESIVATNPQNVDALVGVGITLTTLGQLDQAAGALARAEALASDRPSVLAAQGAMHRAAGRQTLALAYYQRALALQPGDADVRRAYDVMRAERAHRVEGTYFLEHFDIDRSDTQSGLVEVNVRLGDPVRVFALGQYERFNRRNERRAGAGLEWNVHRRVGLRAGALGGRDTLNLSKLDAFGEATIKGWRARLALGARFFDFEVADLWIAHAAVEFAATADVDVSLGYQRSRAELASRDIVTSNGAQLGVKARFSRQLVARAEYKYGFDRLDWLTLDRLGQEDAHTTTLGAAWDFTPFVTLGADYDYQSRPGRRTVHRGVGRFILRF